MSTIVRWAQGVVVVAAATVCIAATSPGRSAGTKDPTLLHLAGRAVTVADASMDAGPIEIRILRWSTDEELETLRSDLRDTRPDAAPRVFRRSRPPAAVVFTPGLQGLGGRARARRAFNCQFARKIETAAGTQIIIATDQPLGLGEARNRHAGPPSLEFVLLDLRLGPDGTGVGKVASAQEVVYDQAKRVVEIADYSAQPVRLRDVRPDAE